MKTKIFCAVALILATTAAQAKALSGAEIEQLIAGKQVSLATTWGSFPLQYGQNYRVTGDGSGLGLAKFFAPKETGKWWVKGNQLCQQFPTWYKGRALCFTIDQTSENTINWKRDDGYSGTATIR